MSRRGTLTSRTPNSQPFSRSILAGSRTSRQSNSNTLQALTTQLDAVTQSLSRQQQNVTFLQAMVAQQTHELQNTEPAAAAAVDERKTQLKALMQQKQALQAHYTPDHPTWLKFPGRSLIFRRRSRVIGMSRRRCRQRQLSFALIRHSCNNSRHNFARRSRQWKMESRSRLGFQSRCGTMSRGSSRARRLSRVQADYARPSNSGRFLQFAAEEDERFVNGNGA